MIFFKKRISVAVFMLILFFAILPARAMPPAEVGTFVHLGDDLPGESDSPSHRDWTKLIAWSESANVSDVARSRRMPLFNQDDLQLIKHLDSVSPKIRLKLASGSFIEEIKLDIVAQCGNLLYTQYSITLVDNVFSSVTAGGNGGQDKLLESILVNTRLMETVYTPVDDACNAQTPIISYREMTFN